MKISKKVYVVAMVVMLGFTMVACGTERKESTSMEEKKEMQEDMDQMVTMRGMFKGEEDIKVSGNVEISDNNLMLTDFSSADGPDVHVWLTNDENIETGYDVAKVDLKSMKQSFAISMNTIKDYNVAVIYSNDAHKVFGSAMLSTN